MEKIYIVYEEGGNYISKVFNVTNRTIINWCLELAKNGYLMPIIVKKRITKYKLI